MRYLHHTIRQYKLDIEELKSKIKRWHDIMEIEMNHSPVYIYRKIIDIIKEMEKELE